MHQLGMKTSIRSAEEFFLYLVLLKTQSVLTDISKIVLFGGLLTEANNLQNMFFSLSGFSSYKANKSNKMKRIIDPSENETEMKIQLSCLKFFSN